ncbi:MAG TPA: hypothetical protein VLA68_07390, partial [Nitrososphaera sp.]|nr:hypothetical protein [Nitrososphaera sp.]
HRHMTPKIFSFDASSFSLEPSVESFLRSKGAISSDFGSAAYINSERVAVFLPELLATSGADSRSRAGLDELETETLLLKSDRERLVQENAHLAEQVVSYSGKAEALKEQLSAGRITIEALEASNAHLQSATNGSSQATGATPYAKDVDLQQSCDRMQKELQELRSQSIEAITSLKVLEDENEELRKELEQLRGQPKVAPATNTI